MIRISVIVPCYNQSQFLDQALHSVLSQSFNFWECIIINDGSTDNTEQVARKWTEKDQRFKYLYQENKGLSCARNFGIQNSKGDFILPLDADDKISSSYLSFAIKAFEKDPLLKIVYCKAEKFGLQDGPLELQPFSLKELCYNNMIFCSALFKKEDWEKVNGYDSHMTYGWEDWEFWIAILKNGGNVHRLEEVGFFYRIKKDSMLKRLNPAQMKELYGYMNIKHADFFAEQGIFFELRNERLEVEKQFKVKLKSEKFVVDLFLKTFFGFTIFGKIEQ